MKPQPAPKHGLPAILSGRTLLLPRLARLMFLVLLLIGGAGPLPGLRCVAAVAPGASATPAVGTAVPQAGTATGLDVEAATRAYLDRLTPEKKARSDAYFEGGYWLQLWDFLYGAVTSLVLLQTRLSARMRDLACRWSRFTPVRTCLYAVQYIALTALIGLPMSVYSGYFREHQYGMANQGLGGWFGDWGMGVVVSLVLGSLLMMALFGVVRKLAGGWHIVGAVVVMIFVALTALIGPVYIAPLFNHYTPLAKPEVVAPIMRIARANGIQADKVYEMDASKQTKRISANVSGMFGTMRITLNDNLLSSCSLPEIEAVMAHEIGHYVLNHGYKSLLLYSIVVVAGFGLLRGSLGWFLARFGARWGITGVGDPAVTPLVVLLFSIYMFVLTPFTNTFTRTAESEADYFGLNAGRQPDGFAGAALKVADYRKMEPGPLEEWVFYDHPSGATRIRAAKRWKAENLGISETTTNTAVVGPTQSR